MDPASLLVSTFYDYFPYPDNFLGSGPPPGYNWRWDVDAAFSFVTGAPFDSCGSQRPLRILDAGCGSGVSTDYLAHLNPDSDILAVDISARTLEVASERLSMSGGDKKARIRFENRSLLNLEDESPFDYINSVGVLHHLQDPLAGLSSLAKILKPGGLLHLFLYAHGGRWAIQRLSGAFKKLDLGVELENLQIGREILANLPLDNFLRRDYEERWSVECSSDVHFADMYFHPYESSFELKELFSLLDALHCLEFAGFSNPDTWKLERLLRGKSLEIAKTLDLRKQWELIEKLDPGITHFEFFLFKGSLNIYEWISDEKILLASAKRSRCLHGWPGIDLLDYQMKPLHFSDDERDLVIAVEKNLPCTSLKNLSLGWDLSRIASVARDLQQKQVLLLSPP